MGDEAALMEVSRPDNSIPVYWFVELVFQSLETSNFPSGFVH